MKLGKMKRIVGIIFGVTLAGTVVYIIYAIYVLLRDWMFTSFPWWSAFYFAWIYFGPLLCAEGIIYLVLYFIQRKGRAA